jgi:hypothetical protein
MQAEISSIDEEGLLATLSIFVPFECIYIPSASRASASNLVIR